MTGCDADLWELSVEQHLSLFGGDVNPTTQFGASLNLMASVSITWKGIILSARAFNEHVPDAGF